MRINQEALRAMAALPDEELWQQVVAIAKSHGFNLPNATPSHAELEKLREVARGPKISLSDAVKLMNDYKRRGGK